MTRRGPNPVDAREWGMLPRLLEYKEVWIFVALLFVVGIPRAYWHQARFARNARLVVGEQGMRMESGLPPFVRAGLYRGDPPLPQGAPG